MFTIYAHLKIAGHGAPRVEFQTDELPTHHQGGDRYLVQIATAHSRFSLERAEEAARQRVLLVHPELHDILAPPRTPAATPRRPSARASFPFHVR